MSSHSVVKLLRGFTGHVASRTVGQSLAFIDIHAIGFVGFVSGSWKRKKREGTDEKVYGVRRGRTYVP